MDDTDDFIEQRETARKSLADEQLRLRVAFGDDVAQRFLRLRGIEGDVMQEAVLGRYAAKQAMKLAREALAMAAGMPTPPRAVFPNLAGTDARVSMESASEEL